MKAYRRPLVQALLPGDIDKGVKWAEDYLEAAERDFTCPTSCGRMKQSFTWMDMLRGIIWSVQNPHALMECSNQKKAGVMIWAGLIKDHIIGPFFINGSVTGQVYLQLQQQRVWPALQAIKGEDEEFVVFQHDGASAHYEPVLEPGWMESLRTGGWAEGDPYYGQHEVLIYLHWMSGFGVT
eukprot:Em0006g760a